MPPCSASRTTRWARRSKPRSSSPKAPPPSDELAAELVAYVREHLAGYKAPRSVDFVDQLPRHPTGKLYKRVLRDPYWEGLERRI